MKTTSDRIAEYIERLNELQNHPLVDEPGIVLDHLINLGNLIAGDATEVLWTGQVVPQKDPWEEIGVAMLIVESMADDLVN